MFNSPEEVLTQVKSLSLLQKKIIYQMVLPEWGALKTQRERNALLYESLGGNSNSTRASVSRAYRGLEDAIIIIRVQRLYELSRYACQIIAKVLEEFPEGDSDDEQWWRYPYEGETKEERQGFC
jgi:hypothetical protein